MQALVKRGGSFDGTELERVPIPQSDGDRALLRVLAAGVCATDLHLADGDALSSGPVVLGHEIVGEITDPGSSAFDRGERVVGFPLYYRCGRCPACWRGAWNLCPYRVSAGVKSDGGFSEYVVLPGESLRKMPKNVEPGEAVMCEPLACAYHAVVEVGAIRAGERAVVTGAGALGLLVLQVAVARGASVAVLERRPGTRADLSKALGAEAVFTGEEAASQALEWSDGVGVDLAVECAGSPAAASAALSLLGAGGRYVQVGTFGGPMPVEFNALSSREASLLTSFASTPASWDAAVELVSNGDVQLAPMFSGALSLADWKEGFQRTRRGEGVRTVLIPVRRTDR